MLLGSPVCDVEGSLAGSTPVKHKLYLLYSRKYQHRDLQSNSRFLAQQALAEGAILTGRACGLIHTS